jgi:hypothetical protein
MKKIIGGALQGCGILIAGLSGLCALGVLIGSIANLDLSLLLVTLVYAGIPFAIGAGMTIAGRSLVRQARGEEERDRLPPE